MKSNTLEFPPVSEVFFALCKSADTPVSLGAWLRFKYNQLALAEMEVNPRDYLDCYRFSTDYGVVSYLSKYKGLDTGLDLEAVAMKKFKASESSCKETNSRIRLGRRDGFPKPFEQIFFIARRKIASLIGSFSPSLLETGFGWGPGATDDIPRRRAYVDTKLCELPISCTPRALGLARDVIGRDLHWSCCILNIKPDDLQGPFCFMPGIFALTSENAVDTVPKNAKTHRVIAKEPRLNAFLQKGVGNYFRKRLKRVGIDLDDQGPNQWGAYRALVDRLATLDLKAASDSVSLELVYELLPVDWALMLDDLRSPCASLPGGETLRLEKFSSMGNGFTFELETLIFWSLAKATYEVNQLSGDLLVYGDDLIVTKECARHLIDVLAYCGFETNVQKSFVDGLFYESCGKHFFHGVEVTPVYQKEVVESLPGFLRSANRLRRYLTRLESSQLPYRHILNTWEHVIRHAPTLEFQIPDGVEGDDGLVMPIDRFIPSKFNRNRGFKCRVILVKPSRRLPAMELALLAYQHRVKFNSPEVVSQEPTYGDVSPPPRNDAHFVKKYRWVHPGW